ncbi:MAG: magnesium transporter [Candidatus Chisholmbacteria bacterium]|nr:magnesium transporter [Candidatus Chisholmbacteria bacterium]
MHSPTVNSPSATPWLKSSQEPVLNIAKTSARHEITKRAPWMFLGLLAGIVMVLLGQKFEIALSQKLEVVFFIPMIVYMSDSIGTETMALFIRELALRRVSLKKLFWRETYVGLFLGVISGVPMGLFSLVWLKDLRLSLTVTIAMIINGLVAVLTGMLTPILFAKFKKDPALGTDEITTAFSDTASLLIYLIVATMILF